MNLEEHIAQRLGFFVTHGWLARVPSAWQFRMGGLCMLPITFSESDRERVRSRSTWLGQVPVRAPLQILYAPHQAFTGTGITQSPERIVRHLLCVYHEDAFLPYDLQLLHSHEGGLALLRREAERVDRGEARFARHLKKLVGWPGYHAGLVQLAERAERFEYPDPLDLDRRFVSLVGFAEFCLALPDWPPRSFYGFERRRP